MKRLISSAFITLVFASMSGDLFSWFVRDKEKFEFDRQIVANERAVFEREEKRFLTPQPVDNPNGLQEVVNPRDVLALRPFIRPGVSRYFVVSLKRGEAISRTFSIDAAVAVLFPGNLGEYLVGLKFETAEGILIKEDWFLPDRCVIFMNQVPRLRILVKISRAPIFKK